MSNFSLAEKIRYNLKKYDISEFSRGYVDGAAEFEEWAYLSAAERNKLVKVYGTMNELGKLGAGYYKGFMCALRDSAKERKRK